MIADALDRIPRSLAQYAEELQEERLHLIEAISGWDSIVPPAILLQRYDDLCIRLLAVEREINWRMGI